MEVTCMFCAKLRLGICLHEGREKHEHSPACKDYQMKAIIWCEKNEQQIDAIVCLNRQNKLKEECVRCREGRQIEAGYYYNKPRQRRKQFVFVEEKAPSRRIQTQETPTPSRRKQTLL